jgi:hypothetical protein
METVKGIYRLYDKKSGQSFVGFTHHMEGTRKRLRFELKLNACSYKPLQAFFNACEDEMQFEPLERIETEPNMSDEQVEALLTARMLYHKAKLNALPVQVRI